MVEVGSIETMLPFAVFLLGITLYAIFVFRFYRFLARKDVFNLDLKQYNRFKHKSLKKMGSIGFYILEYVIIFPVLIVFWSAIMAALLLFLSKGYDTPSVLLISMAVVGAIRFTAYYREDLAKDLAKMLPFGLLAIFLVDTQFISIVDSLEYVIQIPKPLESNCKLFYIHNGTRASTKINSHSYCCHIRERSYCS